MAPAEPLLKLRCPQCGNATATLMRFHEKTLDLSCARCGEAFTVNVLATNPETVKHVQAILLMRSLEETHRNEPSRS
jgi:ribosomal protein S27AE